MRPASVPLWLGKRPARHTRHGLAWRQRCIANLKNATCRAEGRMWLDGRTYGSGGRTYVAGWCSRQTHTSYRRWKDLKKCRRNGAREGSEDEHGGVLFGRVQTREYIFFLERTVIYTHEWRTAMCLQQFRCQSS